ncbi:unnamed protein product [Calypogeia fissa]
MHASTDQGEDRREIGRLGRDRRSGAEGGREGGIDGGELNRTAGGWRGETYDLLCVREVNERKGDEKSVCGAAAMETAVVDVPSTMIDKIKLDLATRFGLDQHFAK